MGILKTLGLVACTGLAVVCGFKIAKAETALVAVAANFTAASKEIAAQFKKETGHEVKLSFGSTGKIYSRIRQGAPYDVFLAADTKRPKLAEQEGFAVPQSHFTYALGQLVLYGLQNNLSHNGEGILRANKYDRLALTNPRTAPYGAAAIEVLQKLGIYGDEKSKLVEGGNLLQTLQFVTSGNAPLGFIAKSQALKLQTGSYWLVPKHLYRPLTQDAVLLKSGADNSAAKEFLAYLRSDKAKAILKGYGYGWP